MDDPDPKTLSPVELLHLLQAVKGERDAACKERDAANAERRAIKDEVRSLARNARTMNRIEFTVQATDLGRLLAAASERLPEGK